MNLRMTIASLLSALVLVPACSDDETATTTTQSTSGSGGTSGPGPGSGGDGGAGVGTGGAGGSGGSGGSGGGESFVTPTPFAVPLSAEGPDQLQSVTVAEDGEFLAAGFAAEAVGGARMLTVVKFSATGPDADFGTAGVVTLAVEYVGGTDEIDIATQSDGKIIVSATVASGEEGDRDVAILRLTAAGVLDTSFGDEGITTVSFNDAEDVAGELVGRDGARALAVDGADNIFVHGYSRALGDATGGGPRTDTDFTIVKLTPDGDVDEDFATDGVFRLDVHGAEANATARGMHALPDGSLIASGYANTPDIGTVQAVLYKLTPDGDLDEDFATNGVFHEEVLLVQTEIYNFAIHGTHLVTAGYGRDSGDKNEYVSLRFAVADGARDTTWGGATNGAVLIDPGLSSNARNAVGLPGGKTLILGSTGPGNQPQQDAVFAVLDAEGQLDTAYGTGVHVLSLGNDGNDQFWGGAISGNTVALVGYQGGGAEQTDTKNDDSYGVVFSVQ